MNSAAKAATVVYVHGAGNKPPEGDLKRSWDQDLFGQDMGRRTRMVYYADLLHGRPGAIGPDACNATEALAALVAEAAADPLTGRIDMAAEEAELFAGLTEPGQQFALSLSISMATRGISQPPPPAGAAAILPLPSPLRRLLLRQLLQRLIPDANGYFFTDRKEPIRSRLQRALESIDGPVVVVSHSLGTVIAYDVLSQPGAAGRPVSLFVTLGSPLGYSEIQDVVARPLRIPAPVRLWANFADPFDLVTLDTSLGDDFGATSAIIDVRVDNPTPNNHAACGYVRNAQVRSSVSAALPTTGPG
jgi:hypothetical protein